jgi:hypothetical protein
MPYPPCFRQAGVPTVIAPWLKKPDNCPDGRRVTQSPFIAGPLGVTNVPTIHLINKEFLSLTNGSNRKEY